ncbi:MAG: EutN/CcmL family microcompartment protein [Acidobacteriota bacterium]
MILARVIGSVVATQKHEKYRGKALLLVQPLALGGADTGDTLLAVDSVGAGAGETVLVVIEGRSTSQAMRERKAPANAAIVGIVDDIHWES